MYNIFLILNYIFTTPTRDLHFLRVFTSFEYIIKHAFHKVSHKCMFSIFYARVCIIISKGKPCKWKFEWNAQFLLMPLLLFHAMKITNKIQIYVAMINTKMYKLFYFNLFYQLVLQDSIFNNTKKILILLKQYLFLNGNSLREVNILCLGSSFKWEHISVFL